MLIELHVPDFDKVKRFYSKLGFTVTWERKPEKFKGYLVMRLENNILTFWGGNDYVKKHPYFKDFPENTQPGYGVEIIIEVANIDGYYAKIKKSVEIIEPLIDQPWGLRDFRVKDPFGFYLRITTPHDILNDQYAVK